ncbi:hypothetical protein BDC45DRAFT_541307 [Circinella umbellata]|nr:hypothetical protein BDC45DRAFT_541307 [Circinella umbellata]
MDEMLITRYRSHLHSSIKNPSCHSLSSLMFSPTIFCHILAAHPSNNHTPQNPISHIHFVQSPFFTFRLEIIIVYYTYLALPCEFILIITIRHISAIRNMSENVYLDFYFLQHAQDSHIGPNILYQSKSPLNTTSGWTYLFETVHK